MYLYVHLRPQLAEIINGESATCPHGESAWGYTPWFHSPLVPPLLRNHGVYPLVNVYIAIENGHSGFTHEKRMVDLYDLSSSLCKRLAEGISIINHHWNPIQPPLKSHSTTIFLVISPPFHVEFRHDSHSPQCLPGKSAGPHPAEQALPWTPVTGKDMWPWVLEYPWIHQNDPICGY